MMSTVLQGISYALRKEIARKSAWEWAGILMLALAVLFMGGHSAFGADFVWDGNSVYQCSNTPGCWDIEDNWTADNGYPGDDDSITIADVSPSDTCTYNLESEVSPDEVTIGGDSPTQMTLHLRDGAMAIDELLTLLDYSLIDADQNLTVEKVTTLQGTDFIDVAEDVTAQLGNVYVLHYGPYVNWFTAQLDATVAGGGVLTAKSLLVDAYSEDDHVGLIYDGHGATFEVTESIAVTAAQNCDLGGCTDIKWAILRVGTGLLKHTGSLSTGAFTIAGGDSYDYRRAIVEVNSEIQSTNVTFGGGVFAGRCGCHQVF